MIIQGWYYYRYSIRCPWPCVCPEQAPSPTSMNCDTHTPVHPLWFIQNSPSLAIADVSCSGCGSGETNDIRASPDHMADRPCSLLERVVENDLGVK